MFIPITVINFYSGLTGKFPIPPSGKMKEVIAIYGFKSILCFLLLSKTITLQIHGVMVLTMKAKEVLNLLQISRKTLHVYSKDGRIKGPP